jgi:hypothetical protein
LTLDQLIIEIALDPKKLTKGQRDAIASFKRTQEDAKRIAISIEDAGRHIVDTLHKIRDEFVSFTAAALEAAGVKEFFDRMIRTNVAVGNLARSLGISVEELSRWEIAIKLSGCEAADADQAIGGLVEQIKLMQIDPTQATHMLTFLRALSAASGVDFAKELSDVDAGKVGAITNLILKIAQAGAGKNVALMTTFFKQMGLPPGFVQALTRGEDALRAYLTQAEKIGPITKADWEAAQMFKLSWDQLSAALTRFGNNMVTVWGPKIGEWLDYLTAKATSLGHILMGMGIGAAIGSAVPVVGTLGGAAVGGGFATFLEWRKGRLGGGAPAGIAPMGVPGMGGALIPGGFAPDFASRLDALKKAMPPGMSFSINSGLRTRAEQEYLYANRGSSPYPVAPPGTSQHERGLAADLRFSSPASEAWIRAHAGEFGLGFPDARDPIHMEMARRYSMMGGARTSVAAGRTSNTNVDSDVHIGNVNINAPHATNARGIAAEFGPFLDAQQRRALAVSANGGAN